MTVIGLLEHPWLDEVVGYMAGMGGDVHSFTMNSNSVRVRFRLCGRLSMADRFVSFAA